MKRARTLLILLLALVLPVQGMAAVFAPVHRALNSDAVASMPCHEPVAVHDGASHAGSSNSTDSETSVHNCCHQVFSGAPMTLAPTVAEKFSDVPRFVLALATLYIPDSPDRPPRG